MNIVYLLFFAAANFIIYSVLNKTGKISNKILWSSGCVFLLFVLLHIIPLNLNFLMAGEYFFPSIFFLAVPIVVYLWFNYFVINRVQRLKGIGEQSLRFAIGLFSFFFLKFIYIIVFAMQCMLIFKLIH